MIIRLLFCVMICLFYWIKGMDCATTSEEYLGGEFGFSTVFEHPQYTIREINPKEKKRSYQLVPENPKTLLIMGQEVTIPANNSIQDLIKNHFTYASVKRDDIVYYLRLHPYEDINYHDDVGRTLLDIAVRLKDVWLINYLKDKGADVMLENRDRQTIYQRVLTIYSIKDKEILDLLYESK